MVKLQQEILELVDNIYKSCVVLDGYCQFNKEDNNIGNLTYNIHDLKKNTAKLWEIVMKTDYNVK